CFLLRARPKCGGSSSQVHLKTNPFAERPKHPAGIPVGCFLRFLGHFREFIGFITWLADASWQKFPLHFFRVIKVLHIMMELQMGIGVYIFLRQDYYRPDAGPIHLYFPNRWHSSVNR